MDHFELARGLLDRDDIAWANEERRNVYRLAVNEEMAVENDLTGCLTGRSKIEAVNNIVKAALEQLDEVITGNTAEACCLLVRVAELALENAIEAADLLLLAKLDTVLRDLLTACEAVLSWWVSALIDWALLRVTLCAL